MTKLRPCECGRVPKDLFIRIDHLGYARVRGDCKCGYETPEFWTGYCTDRDIVYEDSAVLVWNQEPADLYDYDDKTNAYDL